MAEEKIDRLEPDQIKNTGFSKDTDKKTKRQTTAWDKYLQNTHVIKNCAGHQHFCSSQVQIFWTSQVLLCLLYDHGGGLCKYFTWDIWCYASRGDWKEPKEEVLFSSCFPESLQGAGSPALGPYRVCLSLLPRSCRGTFPSSQFW